MDIIALKLEIIEASLAELNKRLIKLEVSKTEQEPKKLTLEQVISYPRQYFVKISIKIL